MYKAEDYTYRVFWSEDDGEWVGTVAEFSLLSHLDKNYLGAAKGIKDVVEFVLEIMAEKAKCLRNLYDIENIVVSMR